MRACFTTCCMSTAGLHSADYALTRRPPDSPSHGGNVYKRHSSLDSVSFLKSDTIWKIATRSPRRNNTVTQFSAINSLYFCAIAEKPRDVWTVSCSWSVVFAFFPAVVPTRLSDTACDQCVSQLCTGHCPLLILLSCCCDVTQAFHQCPRISTDHAHDTPLDYQVLASRCLSSVIQYIVFLSQTVTR